MKIITLYFKNGKSYTEAGKTALIAINKIDRQGVNVRKAIDIKIHKGES